MHRGRRRRLGGGSTFFSAGATRPSAPPRTNSSFASISRASEPTDRPRARESGRASRPRPRRRDPTGGRSPSVPPAASASISRRAIGDGGRVDERRRQSPQHRTDRPEQRGRRPREEGRRRSKLIDEVFHAEADGRAGSAPALEPPPGLVLRPFGRTREHGEHLGGRRACAATAVPVPTPGRAFCTGLVHSPLPLYSSVPSLRDRLTLAVYPVREHRRKRLKQDHDTHEPIVRPIVSRRARSRAANLAACAPSKSRPVSPGQPSSTWRARAQAIDAPIHIISSRLRLPLLRFALESYPALHEEFVETGRSTGSSSPSRSVLPNGDRHALASARQWNRISGRSAGSTRSRVAGGQASRPDLRSSPWRSGWILTAALHQEDRPGERILGAQHRLARRPRCQLWSTGCRSGRRH